MRGQGIYDFRAVQAGGGNIKADFPGDCLAGDVCIDHLFARSQRAAIGDDIHTIIAACAIVALHVVTDVRID